jgi:pimeloyl-ACP methyl ester carboxylesterase
MITLDSQIQEHCWQWQNHAIYYQSAGTRGPIVVLIHGFGASCEHWRKNIPVLAQHCRVYALDLLGFGKSEKPTLTSLQPTQSNPYRFEHWGEQVVAFCQEFATEPVFLVGNSIGCVVALQAAVLAPETVQGVMLLDCALRQICDRKLHTQPPMRRLGRPLLKKVTQNKALIHWLFDRLAQPSIVKKILQTAYGNPETVTDELVEILVKPARTPGAADVFWAFINSFDGPLPEDLLPQVQCPVNILWGSRDPWEPIQLGRKLAEFPCVQSFTELEGVGHCPQDEVPEQVNPLIQAWIEQNSPLVVA